MKADRDYSRDYGKILRVILRRFLPPECIKNDGLIELEYIAKPSDSSGLSFNHMVECYLKSDETDVDFDTYLVEIIVPLYENYITFKSLIDEYINRLFEYFGFSFKSADDPYLVTYDPSKTLIEKLLNNLLDIDRFNGLELYFNTRNVSQIAKGLFGFYADKYKSMPRINNRCDSFYELETLKTTIINIESILNKIPEYKLYDEFSSILNLNIGVLKQEIIQFKANQTRKIQEKSEVRDYVKYLLENREISDDKLLKHLIIMTGIIDYDYANDPVISEFIDHNVTYKDYIK